MEREGGRKRQREGGIIFMQSGAVGKLASIICRVFFLNGKIDSHIGFTSYSFKKKVSLSELN